MSKSKEKQNKSILTELYNLHLTGNPDLEKDKFIDFLSKYAPQVTRYLTDKDIELKLKEGSVDAGELVGSLGWFEHTVKESWWTRGYGYYYDRIYKNIAFPVVDARLQNKEISKVLFVMVGSLVKNVRDMPYCQNEQGQKFSVSWAPNTIDTDKYTFGVSKGFTTELTNGELALGGMEYDLFQDIYFLWNQRFKIGACQLAGCKDAFIIIRGGHTQRYCSDAHKAKGYRQRKSELIAV